jgi:hypothetical protein
MRVAWRRRHLYGSALSRMRTLDFDGYICRIRRQRRRGRCEHRCRARKLRAGDRHSQNRRRSRFGLRLHCGHAHGAMVRPMPTATQRQAGLAAAVDDHRRQRSEPEKQNQENGEAATHLCLIVHWPLQLGHPRRSIGYHQEVTLRLRGASEVHCMKRSPDCRSFDFICRKRRGKLRSG